MKKTHVLHAAHHAHLSKLGIPWLRPPYLRVEDEHYREALALWKKTNPQASPEWLRMKALGHIAWAEHRKESRAATVAPVRHIDHRLPLWVIASLLLVLALVFFAPLAHCQFSKIDYIQSLSSGSPIGFHASPFRINCNSNMSCSDDGFTFTINSTAAAGSSTFQVNGVATTSQTLLNWQNTTCISVANPSAGNVTFTLSCVTPNNTASVAHKALNSYNSTTGAFGTFQPASTDLGDFSTTAPSSSGKIPIYDTTAPNAAGGTGAYVPGDPLVQGVQAAGSATIPNPVVIGGSDYGGTPHVQTAKVDSSGTVQTHETGTAAVSVASLPLPAGAATAAKQPALGTAGTPSTDVISVQGVTSMTPLKVDPSGVTSPVSLATVPLPSGASTAAKQPALGTAGTPSADVITIQGVTSMTPLKVDGSSTTQPVSIAATVAVNNTQQGTASQNVAQVGGTAIDTNSGNKSAGTQRIVLATDQPNLTTALNVNCTSGCTAGGSFADSSAFTFGTTAVGNMSAVVDDVSTNTVAENSAGAVRMNTNRILYMDLSKTAANTNKILVTPDSVALPANQTVNLSQVAGTTTDTNSGAKSAGTIRVVIATDQPQLTNKLLVTPDSVALPANQSVNESQINGVTPLMGNGVTGTGSQRVTIASDNTAFQVKITGNSGIALDAATGAAPPANAFLHAGLGSGATGGFLVGVPVGDTYKAINISTATTTLLVTGVSGRQVRITALHLIAAGADNVALIEGTGATCGTGTAGMAGGTTAASGYNLAANGGLAFGSGQGTILQTVTAGDSVCAVTSAAVQLSGGAEYAIY